MVFLGRVFAGFVGYDKWEKPPESAINMLKLVKNDDSLLDCIHDPISITHGVRFSTQKISKKHLYTPPPKKKKQWTFIFQNTFHPKKSIFPTMVLLHPCWIILHAFWLFGGASKTPSDWFRRFAKEQNGRKGPNQFQALLSPGRGWLRMAAPNKVYSWNVWTKRITIWVFP